jgi:Cu(I)/Ag(I) efflux system membrane fusion protein
MKRIDFSKKKIVAVAAVAAVILAALYLAGRPYLGMSRSDKSIPAPASSQVADEHRGHGAGAPPAAPAGTAPVDTTKTGQPEAAAKSTPQAEAETNQEAPTVEIMSDKQKMIGVKTVAVAIKPLRKVVRAVGRIEYDERRIATVNTKIEGWIEKLYVDYTGMPVRKGDPLAEIYSPELVATQREFINIVKWSKSIKTEGETGRMIAGDARAIVEAARQRLRYWDITDAQIRRIEETGVPIRTLTLYSPVSGYVVQKAALQGMQAKPGEKLFDVADLSMVWVVADIYEYELSMVRINQTAVISLTNFFPGREFKSRIDYVYPALAGDTRTAKVRFNIPNPDGRLKPQMFADVEIKIDLGRKLVIPDSAVIDTGKRQVVYVDKGEGLFEPREVVLGSTIEGQREVMRGLKAGERVASSAAFLIDSEAQLKGVAPIGGMSGHKH